MQIRLLPITVLFLISFYSFSKAQGLQLKQNTIESRTFALLIGTDKYDGKPDWVDLNNPVYDAETVGAILEEDMGYNTEILRNPTSNQILSTLIRYHKVLKANDRFFLFVAGHGDYDDQIFDDGFIVAKDSKPLADDINRKTYISYNTLNSLINKLPAKQVLVVLDVCFSGSFNEKMKNYRSAYRSNIYDELEAVQFAERKLKLTTRSVITSGGLEPVLDGVKGHHSPFAYKFIEALRVLPSQKSVITGSDLYSYVSRMESQPVVGHFGDHEPGADYILGVSNSKAGIVLKKEYTPSVEDFRSRSSIPTYALGKVYDLSNNELLPAKYYTQILSEPSFNELQESIGVYKNYPELTLKVEKVNIKGKEWYRLLTGGYNDRSYADKQLQSLKKKYPQDKHIQGAFIKSSQLPTNDNIELNEIYNTDLILQDFSGYGIQIFSDTSLVYSLTKARVYNDKQLGTPYIQKSHVKGKTYYRVILNHYATKEDAVKYQQYIKSHTEDINLKGAFLRTY
ncbi:caspase family protein [Flammeovirga agarivorans]|uniref:SPOR domain-containing protein n=1 Tax=Flammeovirga agarivorans TaxID=2726742 RepID=A0A7X8SQ97_9BACT|nr:caspase family protein [Flammeovirga agarivorans]NLR94425.1 hypothetical protein [Flammeovirga agarivorans]